MTITFCCDLTEINTKNISPRTRIISLFFFKQLPILLKTIGKFSSSKLLLISANLPNSFNYCLNNI